MGHCQAVRFTSQVRPAATPQVGTKQHPLIITNVTGCPEPALLLVRAVPIAEGEAAVLKSIANFMIPQVLVLRVHCAPCKHIVLSSSLSRLLCACRSWASQRSSRSRRRRLFENP